MQQSSRKQFIKSIGLTTLALLTQQLKGFSYLASQTNADVDYFEKGAVEYDTLRKGFNKRINRFPKIIALCKTIKGVAEATQYAIKNGLKVTVKSGGHCMEGFGNLEGGMVINLSLLNAIEWIDKNTVKIGPACTLKKIYEILIPKGKYLPGGSCQTVAIGGLTLGGGYGLMSRLYGLTCDSLQEVTMVDGKGNIISSKNDADLLWACKGGGNGNFGTITSLTFTIHDAPQTMRSYKFRTQNVSIATAKDICKQWFALTKTLPNSCFSAFIFNGKTAYILLTNIQQNNTAVQEFINKFKALSTKFTEGATLPLGQALKAYYAEANPITFKNASSGLYKNFEEIEPIVTDVFEIVASRPGILYQVNTLGGKIQQNSFENSSSFAHRDCFYFSELQAYWESPTANEKFLTKFEAIQKLFHQQGIRAQYRNYPDINFKNSDQLYYGKNLSRLKAVKNKYDANNLFSGGQTIKS
jgi:FAD binding domain/Berberine and berberine like